MDLFSGLEGWSKPFKDRGHEVITVDINPKFKPDIVKDIWDFTMFDLPSSWWHGTDVILASPPCNCFSMLAVYRHWKKGIPNEETINAINLVKRTLKLISELNPRYWVLENPMGMLRTLSFMKHYHHRLITQCQYGERKMKPTDLWGRFPLTFSARRCKNNSKCHDRTPRGSHETGTQSIKTAEDRALIPYGLALEFCVACEKGFSITAK